MSLYEDLTEILTPYADKINQSTANLDDLRDDFDEIDETVNGTGGGEESIASFTWIDGYGVQYNTGVPLGSESNCSYTDIALDGATHVSGYTRSGASRARGLSFLDEYGTWISGDYNEGASSSDWNYSLDVPDNATTLRITCVTSRKSDFSCTLTLSSVGGLINEVDNHKELIENNEKVKRGTFAHFSFDDVRFCMIDITNNENTYETIFDNPFFAFLKNMHDKYGAVFSLFLFLNNSDGSTIEDYTDKFSSDFSVCSSWLKFGLHEGTNNYQESTVERAAEEYARFITEITRICGGIESIDRCPRLGNFEGNLVSMQAMRDSNVGIVGLLASWNARGGYYLTTEQGAIVCNYGRYVDTVNRLTFYRSIKTFEEYDPATELSILETVSGANRNSYAIMMMHEYAIYTSSYTLVESMCGRVSYSCKWAKEHGYYWNYPMNEIIKSTQGIWSGNEGSDIIIDSSLSVSGEAADAKVVGDEINVLKNTVDTLSITVNGSDGQSIDKTGDASWTDGYGVAGNSGSIIGISNYSYAQYSIPDGVTSISGYTRAGNDISQGMAFYTSDRAYISGDNHYPSSTGYDWNYSFEVPDNAGIVRISCATSRKSQFTCNFTYNTTGGLANDVEDLKTTIEDLSDVSSDITEIKNEIGENLSHYWIDGYCIYLPSSVTNKGLYYQNSSQSIAVVDVRSCAGGIIKGHTRLGDDYGIAFCDKNDICISLVSRSGFDYEWDFEINVPKNAKYAKITCKTTSKTLFAVKGYGIIVGITNSEHLGRFEYDVPQNVFGLDSDRSDFHYDSQTRLQDVYDWFDILMHTFPRNITKVQIGTSTTPEGTYASIDSSEYPINAYIIQGDSYVSGNDFIIASGIHGDESSGDGIQSVISVAYFIRDMLCNPNKNKYLSFMKWNCKILVIPVMNPWGYQNGRRCNGRGIDVNRNFDLNWADSTSYGYSSGTAAFSENESRYIKDYIVNNFANAVYCTELHTRGGNTLSDDDRWWTKVTTGNTTMGNVATDVGRYMQRMYGGSLSDAYTDTEEPTFRSYVDHVIAIPTLLTEFAKSFHQDLLTFNSDMLMLQYVRYFGSMQQGLLDAYLMPNT